MIFELNLFGYGPRLVASKNFCRLCIYTPKREKFGHCAFNYYRHPENWIGPKWGISIFNKRWDFI